ncbi:efflux RND transporter periplasmic adaptor subunit [Ideonella sp. A 288]|uniref:efflux RND transporter periplasmic adaptor subunit n=1 Tax=Ideonella sp. A 288 TaxID=1962181 RepID=UPI000B4AFA5E|nr:efflux RND transporter periplasmic adaptor subunit [Ideonella sp. A 288]
MLQRLAGLLLLVVLGACTRGEPTPEPVRAVRTQVVQGGQAVHRHDYAAEIRPRVESRLGFRVGGKLTRRLVEIGDTVRPGQPLAQLDAQDLRLGQAAAQSQFAAAKASLDVAEAEFRRFKELRDQGFISGMELDRREATLKAARAQADQAGAQSGVQGNQASYAVLTSDVAGTVVGVDAEPGAVVSAGTTVLRIAQDGPRDAVFSVPEERAPAIRALLGKRDAVQVQWPGGAAPGAATVREIAAAADPASRTFLVKADVGTAPVRLGQTATVMVEQRSPDAVIRLPLSAVFEYQGKSTVWLLDRSAMTVQPHPVQVAGAEGNLVVLAGGLSAGQTVVTAGVHVLTPGQKVRLFAEPTLAAQKAAASAAVTAPPVR